MDNLRQSELLCSPPRDVSSLITCYNDTLQSLLDKHAPFIAVKQCAHINAPWYDRQCHQAKTVTATRRLERVYRRDKTDSSWEAWRRQSELLRQALHWKYVEYWSDAITANRRDSKSLWSKINMLLKTPESDVATSHTADDFTTFFRSKVNNIRRATANAPLPVTADRSCSQLSAFDDVSVEEC